MTLKVEPFLTIEQLRIYTTKSGLGVHEDKEMPPYLARTGLEIYSQFNIFTNMDLSISAQCFQNNLTVLCERNKNLITQFFGVIYDGFWGEPHLRPITVSQKFYNERNMWVICLTQEDNAYGIGELEQINQGETIKGLITVLSNNANKPVFLYEDNQFFPIFSTDFCEYSDPRNEQQMIGIIFRNHLMESMEEPVATENPLGKTKFCVIVETSYVEGGYTDPSQEDEKHYYFGNLPSAKLFYDKQVAKFMNGGGSWRFNNFETFSASSTSWTGRKGEEDYSYIFSIRIKQVKIQFDPIKFSFDLV